MKVLNTMKFMYNAITEFNKWLKAIEDAAEYNKAEEKAAAAIGFIDCLHTFNNSMICTENNDFTGDTCEMLDEMEAEVYNKLANKAADTNQDAEKVMKLLKKRDEITEA